MSAHIVMIAPIGLVWHFFPPKPVRGMTSRRRDAVAEQGIGFADHPVELAVGDPGILDELELTVPTVPTRPTWMENTLSSMATVFSFKWRRSTANMLRFCCSHQNLAWNTPIEMPGKIMSIGMREWAYRSYRRELVRVFEATKISLKIQRTDNRGKKLAIREFDTLASSG